MDEPRATSADGTAAGKQPRPPWELAWLALLAWQFWLALGLFGPDPFTRIGDDATVMNGSHPQHFYLATLGAQAFAEHGHTTVFDPLFHIGYLKTPIFDGSRVAEVFLFLGDGIVSPPAAHKIGLLVICMLVPLLLLVACRSAGLDQPTTLLATAIGQLVWWGPLGRGALEVGNAEILLAGLAGLMHVGCLIAFHRRAGVLAWLGLLASGCMGWFLQPLLFPIALPLLLGYYLSVGVKHSFLTWHVAFWAAEQGAVIVNLWWLVDWVGYWWLRSELPSAANVVLAHRNFVNVWNAPLWGGPADRLLTMSIMASALAGIIVLNQTRQRPAARLFFMGAAGALALALLGISWEPLGQVGSAALLAPALWFAIPPAAHAWVWTAGKLWGLGKIGQAGVLLLGGLAGLGIASDRDAAACIAERCMLTRPMTFGLNAQRQELVDVLKEYTRPDARILWEDRAVAPADSRWAALLPRLTERSYVGGLDPTGTIEPSMICLMHQTREHPIGDWTDEQLADYCRRYNIGWIVCWSPSVIQRFSAWSGATKIKAVSDEVDGWLFEVKEPGGYALRGKAELVHADSRFIALKNVEPDNGVVILSLHYQAGMHVSPGRVQIDAEKSGHDPIGFVRLRLAEPAACVTITWSR
jgi:hypothetical protein